MIIQIALVAMLIFVFGAIWKNLRSIEKIDRNLLEAAKGDRELARRLLIRARAKYPEKSQKWYVEKAIEDLNHYVFYIERRQENENHRSELNVDRTTL
jgi:hypothetical protein